MLDVLATLYALTQSALIIACIVVHLHPGIRTGMLATLITGAVALWGIARLGAAPSPAGVAINLVELLLLIAYAAARRRENERQRAESALIGWRILP